MNNNIVKKLKNLGVLKTDEILKNYTSFKTGGPADFMIWPSNANTLRGIIMLAGEYSIPLTVLGGCTNLLVGDKGIRGIVIMMNSLRGKTGVKLTEEGYVYSDAGVTKNDFIKFCIARRLSGMEFMAGIKGCIGGGIIMNAGTADGEFADILTTIEYLDRNGDAVKMPVSKDMIGYRNLQIPGMGAITGGYFKLAGTDDINSVRKKIKRILKERKSKHPLDYPSAGSVFKNPGNYSSWQLIRNAGLAGKIIGGACVSGLHSNFIINYDNASSKDILDLIDLIKEKILGKYGIILETEIRMIGEF